MINIKTFNSNPKYKTLIAEYALKRKQWLFDISFFLICEFGLLTVAIGLLITAHTNQFKYGWNKWYFYIILPPIIICLLYLISREIQRMTRRFGLKLFSDGFILPSNDYDVIRLEPVFIEYFRVEAIWFYTEKLMRQQASGYGIDLGENPVTIWGGDKVVLFNGKQDSIPQDIIILRLYIRFNNTHSTITTGAKTIENGQSAMYTLLKTILDKKGTFKPE